MAASVAQLRTARYAIFDVRVPGRAPQPAGLLLWDEATGEAAVRFRRDFHLIADEDTLEVLIALERDVEEQIRKRGLESVLREMYDGWSGVVTVSEPETAVVENLDRALMRLFRKHVPTHVQRYETHLPRIHLAAAAGSWGEAMSPEGLAEHAEDWIEVPDDLRIDEKMFVAQVVGRSMEPEIPDGSLCVFRYNPAGSRRNRRVLVENYGDATNRYTVKRYQSEKEYFSDGGFRHKRIILEPLNPEFEPWELEEGSECRILGEFIRVLD